MAQTISFIYQQKAFYSTDNFLKKSISLPNHITSVLKQADELNQQILLAENLITPDLQHLIFTRLSRDMTFHSNAIEGNTLSASQVIAFLETHKTDVSKNLQEYLEIQNHSNTLENIVSPLVNAPDRKLIPNHLRDIHKNLFKDINTITTKSITGQIIVRPFIAGEYKTEPNLVFRGNQKAYYYVPPINVESEMLALFDWIDEQVNPTTSLNDAIPSIPTHPITIASIAHYDIARIHPFIDGNGRCARILMNIILQRKQFPLTIIKVDDRSEYLDMLEKANDGDIEPFIHFIARSVVSTQKDILSLIPQKDTL